MRNTSSRYGELGGAAFPSHSPLPIQPSLFKLPLSLISWEPSLEVLAPVQRESRQQASLLSNPVLVRGFDFSRTLEVNLGGESRVQGPWRYDCLSYSCFPSLFFYPGRGALLTHLFWNRKQTKNGFASVVHMDLSFKKLKCQEFDVFFNLQFWSDIFTFIAVEYPKWGYDAKRSLGESILIDCSQNHPDPCKIHMHTYIVFLLFISVGSLHIWDHT